LGGNGWIFFTVLAGCGIVGAAIEHGFNRVAASIERNTETLSEHAQIVRMSLERVAYAIEVASRPESERKTDWFSRLSD